jgi:DNA-binding IclR family transcriptional regulator
MEKKNQGIQSVEQAFEIIDFFSNENQPISLGDAALQMDISKSKLHKYLASFLRIGIITQDINGHYCHGSKLIELGAKILGHTDILHFCEPELQRLRLETQEATALAVWTTQGPMIVRFLESPYPVAISFRVGFHAPLTQSSVGMCFAAFSPEEAYQHLLTAETQGETAQCEEFKHALTAIKDQGYAVRNTINPSIPGAKAISAPIFDATGNIIACILIIGFKQQEAIQEQAIQAICDSSKRLSQQLGHHIST